MNKLIRSFFARDTAEVARDLLGKDLVRNLEPDLLRGKIVETEAYYGEGDPPSHASSGRTGRSKIMWEKPGIAYVYLIYGVHLMFNVVTESSGKPGAVLIRALEPLEGLDMLESNRGGAGTGDLTDGPGKLTQAFGIGQEKNGVDLVESDELWISMGKSREGNRVESSGRIGVSRGKEEQLRFYLVDNGFVSR
ncbi:MAG: DNA-3-methyladenine glycosylase [Candidatus Bipolaricaulota bacterium]|nr:DNA-3-methyladenine glycosylase [Candidatus Bipolaricaulota bacterium]